MTGDAKSSYDLTALGNLPISSLALYINGTSNNPNGSGSLAPYLDNNGSTNNTTPDHAGTDASITFNSSFSFDFNPADGIAAVNMTSSESPHTRLDMPWGLKVV